MVTVGVDYHKRTSTYAVLDDGGKCIKTCKLENTRDIIRSFISSIPGEKQLAMEATRSWGLYHDSVKDLVDQFHLGHPLKMKAITESETKHDKKDAVVTAELTFMGFLPHAHVSNSDTRQLRSILRFRAFLVRQRSSIRNQVQTLIDRNIFPSDRPCSFKDPFCLRGLKWLGSVELPERERFILDNCIVAYRDLTVKIKSFEQYLASQTYDIDGLEYLRSVPGFKNGGVNALTIMLESDNIERFRKARGYAHYAGLVPREFSSGDKHRTGRLVKQANLNLRNAFIESVFAAVRTDKHLRDYYSSVKKRSGTGDAIIATARKLSCIVYSVLKEKRLYYSETINRSRPSLHLGLSR